MTHSHSITFFADNDSTEKGSSHEPVQAEVGDDVHVLPHEDEAFPDENGASVPPSFSFFSQHDSAFEDESDLEEEKEPFTSFTPNEIAPSSENLQIVLMKSGDSFVRLDSDEEDESESIIASNELPVLCIPKASGRDEAAGKTTDMFQSLEDENREDFNSNDSSSSTSEEELQSGFQTLRQAEENTESLERCSQGTPPPNVPANSGILSTSNSSSQTNDRSATASSDNTHDYHIPAFTPTQESPPPSAIQPASDSIIHDVFTPDISMLSSKLQVLQGAAPRR